MVRLFRIVSFLPAVALAPAAGAAVNPTSQPADSASYQLTAPLLPAPAGNGASGMFTATVASTGPRGVFTWKLTFGGLSGPALAAHIRLEAPGKKLSAAVRLCRPCTSGAGGSFSGRIGAGSELLKAILAGRAYATVDTRLNPFGQVIGRVKAVKVTSATGAVAQTAVATLTPAGTSGVSGTAELSWDPDQSALTVTVTLTGLSPGGRLGYTEQITPNCGLASGHLYKLDDFTADPQGNAQVTTQVADVAALDVSGAWSVKIGRPGAVPGSQASGGQTACGPVAAPGATPGAAPSGPPVQPLTVWQTGTGAIAGAGQAASVALAVVKKRGWTSLTVDEVNIFPDWYEVEFDDSEGLKGPEIYVNAKSGNVGPEQGPNSGWDTVYGLGHCTDQLGESAARQAAQDGLGSYPNAAGLTLGDSEQHHGYWEFKLLRQGKVVNQVNVKNCGAHWLFEDAWQPDMIGVYAPNG